MWTRQCSNPLVQVLLTAILLNGVGTGRSETTCSATTSLTSSSVTCRFHKDVSKHKENFIVQFFYPSIASNPDNLLYCYWSDILHCDKSFGVSLNEDVTDQVTVTSPSKADRQSGLYRCQLVPSNHVASHTCQVTFVETVKTVVEDDTHDGDKTALILAVLSIVLFGIFICVLVPVVCCCRERIYKYLGKRLHKVADEELQIIPAEKDKNDQGLGSRDSRQAKPVKPGEEPEKEHLLNKGQSTHPSLLPESGPSGHSKGDKGQIPTPAASSTTAVPGYHGNVERPLSAAGASSVAGAIASARDTGELRILIIGRVKTGKSILGNNIVGKTPFLVGTLRPLAGLMTTEPTEASAEISGRKIKVVDTSSLSTLNPEGMKREVDLWKKMTAPGPSAILFLVRCDRIEDEDYAFYTAVKQLWGDEDSFCTRLIVVLTFADKLRSTSVEEKLDKTNNKHLSTIIAEAGNRYIPVDNVAENKEKPDYFGLIDDKIKQLV